MVARWEKMEVCLHMFVLKLQMSMRGIQPVCGKLHFCFGLYKYLIEELLAHARVAISARSKIKVTN